MQLSFSSFIISSIVSDFEEIKKMVKTGNLLGIFCNFIDEVFSEVEGLTGVVSMSSFITSSLLTNRLSSTPKTKTNKNMYALDSITLR